MSKKSGFILDIPRETYSEENYPDPQAVPANEYTLEIVSVSEPLEGSDEGKWAGRKYFRILVRPTDGPPDVDLSNPAIFNHLLLIPNEDLSDDYAAEARRWRKFIDCFGLETEQVDPAVSWVGCIGRCMVSVETSEAYGEQNRIKSFRI